MFQKPKKKYLRTIETKEINDAWIKVFGSLQSQNVSTKDIDDFGTALVAHDRLLSDKQWVYFFRDKKNKMVKIGISQDIQARIRSAKKQYNTDDLYLVGAIPYGGEAIEKRLHKRFKHLNVKNDYRDKGEEFFYEKPELTEFINELNKYAVKSTFLIKEGLMQA